MDKVCQVRSIVHQGSQHSEATHWMLTGYPQVPDVNGGSRRFDHLSPASDLIVSKELAVDKRHAPLCAMCAGRKWDIQEGAYLGSAYNALMVRRNPNDKDFSG